MHELLLEAACCKECAHGVAHLRATRSKILRILIPSTTNFLLARHFAHLRLALPLRKFPLARMIADDLRNGAQARFVAHEEIGVTLMMRNIAAQTHHLLIVIHFVMLHGFVDRFWLLRGRRFQVVLPGLLLAGPGSGAGFVAVSNITNSESFLIVQLVIFDPVVVIIFIRRKLALDIHLIRKIAVMVNRFLRRCQPSAANWLQTGLFIGQILLFFVKTIEEILVMRLDIADLLGRLMKLRRLRTQSLLSINLFSMRKYVLNISSFFAGVRITTFIHQILRGKLAVRFFDFVETILASVVVFGLCVHLREVLLAAGSTDLAF